MFLVPVSPLSVVTKTLAPPQLFTTNGAGAAVTSFESVVVVVTLVLVVLVLVSVPPVKIVMVGMSVIFLP